MAKSGVSGLTRLGDVALSWGRGGTYIFLLVHFRTIAFKCFRTEKKLELLETSQKRDCAIVLPKIIFISKFSF